MNFMTSFLKLVSSLSEKGFVSLKSLILGQKFIFIISNIFFVIKYPSFTVNGQIQLADTNISNPKLARRPKPNSHDKCI